MLSNPRRVPVWEAYSAEQQELDFGYPSQEASPEAETSPSGNAEVAAGDSPPEEGCSLTRF